MDRPVDHNVSAQIGSNIYGGCGREDRSDRPKQTAVGRASRTLRQVGWFEVVETRGHVEDGKVAHYQVTLKVGFTLDDDD
jgi:flavin-binding protein dodecin